MHSSLLILGTEGRNGCLFAKISFYVIGAGGVQKPHCHALQGGGVAQYNMWMGHTGTY